MAIWSPITREQMTVSGGSSTTFAAGNSSNDFTVKIASSPVTSGELRGVSIVCNASNGAGHKAHLKVYSNASKSDLLYKIAIDLENDASGSDVIAPIPLFETPTYVLTDENGGGGKSYWVRCFVRTTG